MKQKKTSIRKLAGDVLMMGAVLAANKLLKRKEENRTGVDMHDPKLQRKLTMLSVVYHAIGIFYNE
jgi:hypothetical protein